MINFLFNISILILHDKDNITLLPNSKYYNLTMEKKKIGQAEKILRELGKSIDDLISKSRNSKGDIKKEFDERVEEIKRNKKTLEKKLAAFKEEHAEDFEKFELKLQEAVNEVKEAFDKLFKKQKKD
jgi:dsDNA-specific endonuclease/ATPase MutS2